LGCTLGNIVKAETTSLEKLSGKKIAIDAFNSIYAFLSIIRQPDGSPLVDRNANVTSHLSGLFYRNLRLMGAGVLPAYVFDGEPPLLKSDEIARRKKVREAARTEWQIAVKEGRIEDALKAAKSSSTIAVGMIEESKELLKAMGIPVFQAESEGEAMAAQMTNSGIVWASASQDNDVLLYGGRRMLRNLVGRRIPRSKADATSLQPEIIDLHLNLQLLGISREQLIDVAILVGTDYNEHVPGVGQKTALKLVREYGSLEKIEKEKKIRFDFPYQEIRDIFLNPPEAKGTVSPNWRKHDTTEILRILCSEHDFSEDRVARALERLEKSQKKPLESPQRKSLTEFF